MDVDQLKVLNTSLSSEMRSEALRKMAVFLKQYLREEDVMARLDETIFAFLLPDISEQEAKVTMEKLQTRIAWTPFEIGRSGVRLNLSGAAGVVAYDHNGIGANELIAQATRALQQAEGAGYGKVRSFQESLEGEGED
jgi:diguanylate cyclase (GGDEF)-like protein